MTQVQTAVSSVPRWRLLSRPGCHLCDEFGDELLTAFPRLATLLDWAEVDSRDDWRERYGRSIPVLLDPAGRAVCESAFDRAAVAAALARQPLAQASA